MEGRSIGGGRGMPVPQTGPPGPYGSRGDGMHIPRRSRRPRLIAGTADVSARVHYWNRW
ncbi:MAG TPA: hypothetical protein VFA09_02445 [Ktedonobacteraceae bacterium]|nr:hypothetical protein [Ktedonobacteraceae bacterium]